MQGGIAMKSDGGSFRAAQKAVNEVFEEIETALPAGASKRDVSRVRRKFGPAFAAELDRLVLRRMLTSELVTPTPKGYSLFLRAVPNRDFGPKSHEANVDVPGRWIPVSSLADARQKALDFIRAWDLGGGNWSGGEVASDGKVVARISYNGRIWDTATGQEIPLAKGATTSRPDRAKPTRAKPAATLARSQTPKPISFSTRRQKIRPQVKQAIDDEIENLSRGQQPNSFVKDWPGLNAAGIKKALLAAGRKKLGAVVELIRRIRRERPDLDPALKDALTEHGELNERGTAVLVGTGIEMGLGMVKPEVARLLWAVRYLNAEGEL